jgi:hypothetical protein
LDHHSAARTEDVARHGKLPPRRHEELPPSSDAKGERITGITLQDEILPGQVMKTPDDVTPLL